MQLDVGNSSAKWRVVQGDTLLGRGSYREEDPVSREELLACCEQPDYIWVSSVASAEQDSALSRLLQERWNVEPWFARSEAETLGLRNSYTEPERMGVDRWLAMLAARERSRGRLCVVDAGSALTIDLVSAAGEHEGGYIIPGPDLMERALLLDTDRVRFSEASDYRLDPGCSTAQAVRHGIALAQVGAVRQALAEAGSELHLVLTGGGAAWLYDQLGRCGEFIPDLVLDGLQLQGELRAA
ncbi:type III pantothenate kinase [Parahaliea maris]|uniref:Type III pantothenate kinase n=1 Tax=Parahaliea maris TaxID=2716870 RepID=A0A5C9A9F1_9GAMM|nr:type III pantothenate kinase [Parahaliea maris]